MKQLHRICAIAAMTLAAVIPASASDIFRFGIKAGVDINKMSMTKDAFSSDNRAGFTGGLTAQFTVPIINVGADLSDMYVHRASEVLSPSSDANITDPEVFTLKNDYIDIPLHLRYNLALPAISKIVVPYIFTGPDFSFNLSRKIVKDYKKRNFDCIWDFGLGLRLIDHLEIGASYGVGMTKALKYVGTPIEGIQGGSRGRANCWTVTAAWLF
ncbi:MAG: PorT family protein [Muribaculaceae bacterium]|nr:PorT family protein [Muribaculaceae bacterium]